MEIVVRDVPLRAWDTPVVRLINTDALDFLQRHAHFLRRFAPRIVNIIDQVPVCIVDYLRDWQVLSKLTYLQALRGLAALDLLLTAVAILEVVCLQTDIGLRVYA